MNDTINVLEFSVKWGKARQDHPNWRSGQTAFNVLYDMYPTLADSIRCTEADPYYYVEGDP